MINGAPVNSAPTTYTTNPTATTAIQVKTCELTLFPHIGIDTLISGQWIKKYLVSTFYSNISASLPHKNGETKGGRQRSCSLFPIMSGGEGSEIVGRIRQEMQRETCTGELTVHHCHHITGNAAQQSPGDRTCQKHRNTDTELYKRQRFKAPAVTVFSGGNSF